MGAEVRFDRLRWLPDRVLLGDLVFRLEHFRDDDRWDLGDRAFRFYKLKHLVDQYETAFAKRSVPTTRILELGIFDGGSIAFWNELLQPERIVGLDLEDREDSPYFRDYAAARPDTFIRTHWRTDQADPAALRRIVDDDLGGRLDLVFDDASHHLGPTLASFETLFPLLRPGGLYVIEDWAWNHWAGFDEPGHGWSAIASPTELVLELVEATGTGGAIASLEICSGFVIVERGVLVEEPFKLAGAIRRRRQETRRPVKVKMGAIRHGRRLARKVLGMARTVTHGV